MPLLLTLALTSCARRQQFESLARDLAEPVKALCSIQRGEGGGCHGDCLVWSSAEDAFTWHLAAAAIAELPSYDLGPDAARRFAELRTRAAELDRALGPECATRFDRGEPIDRAATCAAHRRSASTKPFSEAFAALVATPDRPIGITIPDPDRCPRE
ncbi:MAG: hypothetical protein KIT84_42990 [Labilithrix sp.]|nr:hypothetical protein [Labilithrix sp.]